MNSTQTMILPTHAFDARGVAKRFRHAAIFGALETLNPGETMRFVNDHDPLPLLQQIAQRYGNRVRIAYIAREIGNIVIDFAFQSDNHETVSAAEKPAITGGGCGSSGCSCH